jgi:hypothetical protein
MAACRPSQRLSRNRRKQIYPTGCRRSSCQGTLLTKRLKCASTEPVFFAGCAKRTGRLYAHQEEVTATLHRDLPPSLLFYSKSHSRKSIACTTRFMGRGSPGHAPGLVFFCIFISLFQVTPSAPPPARSVLRPGGRGRRRNRRRLSAASPVWGDSRQRPESHSERAARSAAIFLPKERNSCYDSRLTERP